MGDWLELKRFNHNSVISGLSPFASDWKPYNLRKPNNRWGLSVTSLDGSLSGVPDLDSLYEYNLLHGTNIHNHDINKCTDVYNSIPELQAILEPWKPWLGRCHLLKLNSGGFFPDHYDINKIDLTYDEVRLVGFVKNNDKSTMKFIYEDKLINVREGSLYWFNASKAHSVFSMTDDCMMLIVCLKFDETLFETLLKHYRIK